MGRKKVPGGPPEAGATKSPSRNVSFHFPEEKYPDARRRLREYAEQHGLDGEGQAARELLLWALQTREQPAPSLPAAGEGAGDEVRQTRESVDALRVELISVLTESRERSDRLRDAVLKTLRLAFVHLGRHPEADVDNFLRAAFPQDD